MNCCALLTLSSLVDLVLSRFNFFCVNEPFVYGQKQNLYSSVLFWKWIFCHQQHFMLETILSSSYICV